MTDMRAEATAPGKMILFGEHSVVYRGPAVVLAIDRRARVTAQKRNDRKIFVDADNLGFSGYFEDDVYYPARGKAWRGRNLSALNMAARKTMEHLGVDSGVNMKVRSMIPMAVGLGSSAAVCVATVGAVQQLFDANLSKEEISRLALEGETIIHGKPSGVDNTVSAFGGVISYERGLGFKHYKVEGSMPFIIGDTMRKRSTRMMVENVAALKERNPDVVDSVLGAMAELSARGLDALLARDLAKLGDLMNINQGLLSAIGVSTMKLESLIHTARRNGALGAKLTGAGGGGCMIAVAEERDLSNVEKAIRRRKSESYRVTLTDRGVECRWVEDDDANS
ncbi:mevalonate kinase [Candidatus Bathyarchaeota archaeon RBG_16_57_9]|nr:MAG: mevalonate kinase [Candidatus Bathyarchaeota archaeon RBG_16_57_9]OGD52419.1 MAG: mevalonate kinase [Candidatus Bathyarchaeota archaeon RBG_13_60_20]